MSWLSDWTSDIEDERMSVPAQTLCWLTDKLLKVHCDAQIPDTAIRCLKHLFSVPPPTPLLLPPTPCPTLSLTRNFTSPWKCHCTSFLWTGASFLPFYLSIASYCSRLNSSAPVSAKPSPILLVRMGCISFVIHLYFPVPKPTMSNLQFQPYQITCLFPENWNHVTIMFITLSSIVSSHFALQAVLGSLMRNQVFGMCESESVGSPVVSNSLQPYAV